MLITCLSIGLIFFFAGLVQGLTGFGSALVAIPLLCFFIDVKQVVPLCVLNGIVITTILFVQLRGSFDKRKIIPLFIGAVPGVIIGATLLRTVDAGLIRCFIGILIIGYSIYSLSAPPKQRNLHPRWAWVAGFLSGAIGTAFSAGGPPSIIYATLTGWPKDEIKATLTAFFFFSAFPVALAHALSGITTKTVLLYFLASVLFVISGTIYGTKLYLRLPEKNYLKLVLLFLILMGGMMIFGTR